MSAENLFLRSRFTDNTDCKKTKYLMNKIIGEIIIIKDKNV